MVKVLYEDNHLIAVFKPGGILVQGDETGDKCLMDEVKEYLKIKYNKPGQVFLGLIHRLDRPVSGIVLFAKTSKGASRLSDQVRSRKVKKVYQALVEGVLEDKSNTLMNYILKDEKINKVEVFDFEMPGALYAELDYRVLKTDGKNSWLEVNLKTGRPHQIRSQLAYIGHPIIGDVKYGAKSALPDKTINLCATLMNFETATGGETKTVTVAPPFRL